VSRLRVLVTGAAGYIASQLLPSFRELYDLVLLDVRNTDRQGRVIPDIILADLTDPDLDRYRAHFRGVEVVVHLAYVHRGPDPRRHYYDERTNIDMAYHVYQVSLEEGVRRVVVASSNHAADWYEHLIRTKQLEMIGPESPRPLSDNFYGWAKECYEHLGFIYASGALGRRLEIVQIRIGAPREIRVENFLNDPVGYKRDLGAYISQRDLQQLFNKSIQAPNIDNEWGVPFQVFYGISDNARKFWSIANARRVIGYAPEDDSEVRYARDIAWFLGGLPRPEHG